MRNSDSSILQMLYGGTTSIQEFNWDHLTTTPMYSLIGQLDIDYIRSIILSPRYSGNNRLKMKKIDDIMHNRGFKRFAGGTNRLVYTHYSAPNAVFKVAIDSVGINDNPAEFINQHFLKPYCCKVFECSPCGTIASFEMVDRITTFDEFYSIGDDYYYLITRKILGKYVMEDIGIDFFMNFGIRRGFGPVILDFPYLFELDGGKLYCSIKEDDGTICGGEIDYDVGFNHLECKRCKRQYKARDLAKPPKESNITLIKKGGRRMKFSLVRNDGTVVKTYDSNPEMDYLPKQDKEAKNNGEGPVVKKRFTVPIVREQVAKTVESTVVEDIDESSEYPTVVDKKVEIKPSKVSLRIEDFEFEPYKMEKKEEPEVVEEQYDDTKDIVKPVEVIEEYKAEVIEETILKSPYPPAFKLDEGGSIHNHNDEPQDLVPEELREPYEENLIKAEENERRAAELEEEIKRRREEMPLLVTEIVAEIETEEGGDDDNVVESVSLEGPVKEEPSKQMTIEEMMIAGLELNSNSTIPL